MHVLFLSTTQSVCLIIVTVAISLFFILSSALAVAGLVLVSKAKKLVAKAENAIDSVEEATDAIKNMSSQAGGPLAALKIIKSIVDIFGRKK